MPNPSISVIIPVHNGAAYLAEAIGSVLAQTHAASEIIVVDDGSTDDSVAIARAYGGPVVCHAEAHAGAGAARNTGVLRASGELLAFLDADDLWMPKKLAAQVLLLNNLPGLMAVLGQVEHFVDTDADEVLRRRLAATTRVQAGYHIGTLLIRREAFHTVGPLNTALRSGEFIDWWARAIDAGLSHQVLPDIVMCRRLHTSNHTLQHRDTLLDYTLVAKAMMDRRRQKGTP